jgi:hypothetical protein
VRSSRAQPFLIGSIEVMRERYGEYFQFGFLAWLRMNVQAAHERSFCKLTGTTQ